jgi:hypothetical protein
MAQLAAAAPQRDNQRLCRREGRVAPRLDNDAFVHTVVTTGPVPLSCPGQAEQDRSLKHTGILQVSRACEPCRRSKTKCDEQRPCSRCTARRTISQCLGKVGAQPRRCLSPPATIQPISFFWQVPLQSVNGFVQCAPSIERPMAYDAAHSDSGMVSSTRTRDSIFKRTR